MLPPASSWPAFPPHLEFYISFPWRNRATAGTPASASEAVAVLWRTGGTGLSTMHYLPPTSPGTTSLTTTTSALWRTRGLLSFPACRQWLTHTTELHTQDMATPGTDTTSDCTQVPSWLGPEADRIGQLLLPANISYISHASVGGGTGSTYYHSLGWKRQACYAPGRRHLTPAWITIFRIFSTTTTAEMPPPHWDTHQRPHCHVTFGLPGG